MYTYNARYISNDGDTIKFLVDVGFGIHKEKTVRLLGVDTPELRSKDPQVKAKAYDAKHFVGMMLAGGDIIVKTHKDKEGKHGRYLAEVFVRKEEKSLNELLLEEGLAEVC